MIYFNGLRHLQCCVYSVPPLMQPSFGNDKSGSIRGMTTGEGKAFIYKVHVSMLCIIMHIHISNNLLAYT